VNGVTGIKALPIIKAAQRNSGKGLMESRALLKMFPKFVKYDQNTATWVQKSRK
jgi:hypothetical protein